MKEDMYRVCRWCKYFDAKTQTCVNDRAFHMDDDFDFSQFTENGHLAEAIREGFKDFKFVQLEQALFESSLSKKKQAEIMKLFREELDDAFVNWTESIDDSVSTALTNFDFEFGGVSVVEPSDFCCNQYF